MSDVSHRHFSSKVLSYSCNLYLSDNAKEENIMYLSSMFLAALGEHFEPSDIKRAFSKTNQHFMIQENVSEEEIQDLLDVCQEFLPQTFSCIMKCWFVLEIGRAHV